MKPSTIYGFWVHITCAWFMEEIAFKNTTMMEPADGLTKIDPSRFQQVKIVIYMNFALMFALFCFVFLVESHTTFPRPL